MGGILPYSSDLTHEQLAWLFLRANTKLVADLLQTLVTKHGARDTTARQAAAAELAATSAAVATAFPFANPT